MSEPALWIALTACLLIGCYLAACTLALKTYSRARLSDLLEQAGQQRRLSRFVARVPRLLLMAGTLRSFFNLMVLLAMLGLVRQWLPVGWNPVVGDVMAFILAGILISVFGVAIPVSWAKYHPERLLAWSIRPLEASLLLVNPMVSFLHLLDPVVRRVTGGEKPRASDDPLTDDLLSVVQEHEEEGSVDQVQKQMIEALIDLPSTTADEIMTPRIDVQGIEVHTTFDEVRNAILEHGHSRIPVYEENLDNIVGILYAKDMLRLLGSEQPFELRGVLRDAMMVPQSKSVRQLLTEFKSRKVHIAIVLDEYGGTAGLVTIEDVLEEIVGEIQDEYEPTDDSPTIQRLSEHAIQVDARVYVDDLNDELGLALPEDADYDTVGGFVFSTLGHIPEVGEHFDYEGIRITVTAAERTKVLQIRLDNPRHDGGSQPGPPNEDRLRQES